MRKGARGFDALCSRQWAEIERLVTREECDREVERAADEAETTIKLGGAGWGWSGGKDSLALEVVVNRIRSRYPSAIPYGVCGIVRALEFPCYLRWVEQHLPAGVEVWSNDTLTYEWLAQPEHRHLVFKGLGVPGTTSGGLDAFWTMAGTRKSQHWLMRTYKPTAMIYGRRISDKNVCGDSYGLMRSKLGLVYNPIRNWSHLLTLGVIHYFWGRDLPPIYAGEDGWSTGTASWPSRRMAHWRSWGEAWQSTYDIDPEVLDEASEWFPSARLWLAGREAHISRA